MTLHMHTCCCGFCVFT